MTDWLKVAKESYSDSTTYVDANYRKKWEDALSMFQSKHPRGSKYLTETYRLRSKLFRPKSRSIVRKHEAAAAAAFFTNIDIVEVTAEQSGNAASQASADVMKELLNYRLTKTIPWFQTLVGGFQDALTVGVVCSYQYWKFEGKEDLQYQPLTDENGQPVIGEDGKPEYQTIKSVKTIKDEPCIELIPVENIRISPGASWIDPINSSPYVIRLIPMFITDIKAMMQNIDPKTGAAKWKSLDDGQIMSAMDEKYDSTRQVREGKREDSTDQKSALTDFDIAWVHENIVRLDDEEVVYFTMGTEFLLTDPLPLKKVYFHGERPYTMGCSVIETHKNYPDSIVMLGTDLQVEANNIQNQRMDNVKLVLNRRWKVKRGAQVDLKSLMRNAAGTVTLVNAMDDIDAIEIPDVTASSYQEQDRINVDYDELTGNFAASSIQTNRTLNDTVGGMKMLSGAASAITEYTIRTFTETWVEKVLRQLVKLEQAYETDQTVLALAADKAKLFQKYGVNQVTDKLLNHELTLTVNVGMNATDPTQRLNKFVGAVMAIANVAKAQAPGIDIGEIGKEIFGIAGYKDGARFMAQQAGQDPKLAQAGQVIQQLHQQLQTATDQNNLKLQTQRESLQAEMQQHVTQLRADMQETQSNNQTKMLIEQMRDATQRDMNELTSMVQLLVKMIPPPPNLEAEVNEDLAESK